jgi:hypothetical protein
MPQRLEIVPQFLVLLELAIRGVRESRLQPMRTPDHHEDQHRQQRLYRSHLAGIRQTAHGTQKFLSFRFSQW